MNAPTTPHTDQDLPAMPSLRVHFPDGDKLDTPGEWGYTHVDSDDLWQAIELLRAYAAKIDPVKDSPKPAGPRFRLLAATLRITARLADAAAASVDQVDDGAQCHARLAEINRAETEAMTDAAGVREEDRVANACHAACQRCGAPIEGDATDAPEAEADQRREA
jgi:hypothetical protein